VPTHGDGQAELAWVFEGSHQFQY